MTSQDIGDVPQPSEATSKPVEQDMKSVSSQQQHQPLKLFSTRIKYHSIFLAFMALLPLTIIMCAFMISQDPTFDDARRIEPEWVTLATIISVSIIYIFWPKEVDVRSDGSVGIKTFLITVLLTDVSRAYEVDLEPCECMKFRKRIWLTTSFNRTSVVVVRKNGKWDLIVTPYDAHGFINAIEHVTMVNEQGITSPAKADVEELEKPDLSSV